MPAAFAAVVRSALVLGAALVAAPTVSAQSAGAPATADEKPREWVIAATALAAPAPLREGAEVRGWTEDGRLEVLRPGTNGIICLADQPGDERFAAACYHESLEPFMERGRQLRREGVEGMARNEARWAEIEAGTLPMPVAGMVYNLGFPNDDFDPATIDPATGGRLQALYMPGATPESTGVPAAPGDGPWLMFPGTPSAHIMISLPAKRDG